MLSEKSVKSYISTILQEKDVPEKFAAIATGTLARAYFNQDEGCMEIVTNTYVKKEIAKKLGLKSPGPVGSGLNKLSEAGFLKCVENGVYRFNPAYFGDRPWAEVQEIRIQKCFGIENNMSILAKYGDKFIEFKENLVFLTDESNEKESENVDENVDDVKENSETATEAAPAMNPPEENPKMQYPFD